jgi:hypothetical protein
MTSGALYLEPTRSLVAGNKFSTDNRLAPLLAMMCTQRVREPLK